MWRSVIIPGAAVTRSGRMVLPAMRLFAWVSRRWFWRPHAYQSLRAAGTILQGEGGEQGDPLMPALFAVGQHASLQAASARLRQGEKALAFLDDLYVITTRDRAKAAFEAVSEEVAAHAGIRLDLGKLKGWCRGGGPPPPGIASLGEQAHSSSSVCKRSDLKTVAPSFASSSKVSQSPAKNLVIRPDEQFVCCAGALPPNRHPPMLATLVWGWKAVGLAAVVLRGNRRTGSAGALLCLLEVAC